jgi:hypothetical protein
VTDGGAVFAGLGFLLVVLAVVVVGSVLVAIGIGYWCMKLFESKGRSGGAGFLMGFALTVVFSVAGAVAALVVAYLWDAPVTGSGQAPAAAPGPPPPPASAEALTIADFTSVTGWCGRRILFDRGLLQVEGVCAVLPAHVLAYARQGYIRWASDAMRDWIEEWAAL